MELMSSLLLFALVALLPQALGIKRDHRSRASELDIKFNNSMLIHQMPMPKKILLNINGPPLVNMVSELQVVFMDVNCKNCIDCMERAIKAYKTHYHIIKSRPRNDELREELLVNRIRSKREVTTKAPTTRTKKNKSKKKTSKTVTVTKYNVDSEVYALQVKEMNVTVHADRNNTAVSTCQVYSVSKSYPCDTAEAEAVLTDPKKNKKTKKPKEKKKSAHYLAPQFRKREVDNSQVPENFMPSIEELY